MFGIAQEDVRIDVDRAGILFGQLRRLRSAIVRSTAGSGPKTFTSTGLDTPARSPIWSLHQRNQLDLQLRHFALDSFAQRVEDFGRRPPLAGRLEADKNVAGVRLGGKKTEFGPGPPDVARNVRRPGSIASTRRSTLSVWASEVPTGIA